MLVIAKLYSIQICFLQNTDGTLVVAQPGICAWKSDPKSLSFSEKLFASSATIIDEIEAGRTLFFCCTYMCIKMVCVHSVMLLSMESSITCHHLHSMSFDMMFMDSLNLLPSPPSPSSYSPLTSLHHSQVFVGENNYLEQPWCPFLFAEGTSPCTDKLTNFDSTKECTSDGILIHTWYIWWYLLFWTFC